MASAYPGLFYPGQVYPGQIDTVVPPPPVTAGDTSWGSWKLTHAGTWIRRETRVLVWGQAAPGPDVIDGVSGTDILDGASGTDLLDGIFPPPTAVPIYDGNGTSELLDGGGTTTSITDGNGDVTGITIPPSPDAMPVGNLPGWTQYLAQDFTTDTALGAFAATYPGWASYDGFTDTSARWTARPAGQVGVYDSATTTTVTASIFDALLHTNTAGSPRVFAITPPNQGGTGGQNSGNLYGRYSVRFRIPTAVPRYKIAWLLWPIDDTWTEGEVDFPEGDLNTTIQGYSHDTTGTPSNNAYAVDTGVAIYGTAWHVTTIEWTPTAVTFFLDGAQVGRTTSAAGIPTHPMRWVLQTETWIQDAAPDPTTTGHVQVDWVVAYRYTP